MNNSILITGVNGFIGRALYEYLQLKHLKVLGLVRGKKMLNKSRQNIKSINTINNKTNWRPFLMNIDTVIHTAGYSKFPTEDDSNISNLFNVNVLGTLNLAKQASECGVRKFIYISSIKVHGENTKSGKSFNNSSAFNPEGSYALSKVQAEQGLEKIRNNTSLDIIIIRPPLVYGKGMKSNLLKLIKLIDKGFPLPFKSIHNKISVIALDNLTDFIYKCILYNKFLNANLVISDSSSVSTKLLVENIAHVLNKKPKLFYFPRILLIPFTYIINKKIMKQMLFNLEIDNTNTKKKLDWRPKIKLKEGLRRIVDG